MSAPTQYEPNERKNEQEYAELYAEKKQFELALVQRIARGLTTSDDAIYVAGLCGLTTKEKT